MTTNFEELDRRRTSMGEISLRRRFEPVLRVDVFEAKLDDEFLMSTLFTATEIALADLGLAATGGDDLDVVVGGLGLGYTAAAVLRDPRVRSLHVVEALDEVIGWHRRGLLPLSAGLTADARCHTVHGDFFALVAAEAGFGRTVPDRVHALLVDIDHSPEWVLHGSHAGFYEPAGLRRVLGRLHPGGTFGLWSDAAPDPAFVAVMEQVFPTVEARVATFPNPYTGGESSATIYLASAP